MHLVFVRHGAPRKGESDPGLTSAGRRMAFETGRWLRDEVLLPLSLEPLFIRHTPTQRTRETAEELALSFDGVRLSEGSVSPELIEDWQSLVDRLGVGVPRGRAAVLVGHHPTVGLLLDHYGPPPVNVPRRNLAVAMVLSRLDGTGWRIHAAWPGRPVL